MDAKSVSDKDILFSWALFLVTVAVAYVFMVVVMLHVVVTGAEVSVVHSCSRNNQNSNSGN